jgi:glycogen(starch) synthase
MSEHQSQRRCLLLSYAFAPGTGGIETVSRLLAGSLAERNYDVRVVTATPSGASLAEDGARSYRVIREPSLVELYRQLRWCHVALQSNFSLRLAAPLICGAVSRPWIVVHHTPIMRPSGAMTFRDRLKLWSLGRAQCYSVSKFLASTTPVPSEVLLNPYDDAQFRLLKGVRRDQPLMFLGRLVPAKGVDVLLQALAVLKREALTPGLTIVGNGPEEQPLRQLVTSLGIGEQVRFVGTKRGPELVRLLNQHEMLVVPSRPAPPEALGIVALEAIACGCVVIGANQGGLPEAIGPCGVTFQNESAPDLALKIRELLESPQRRAELSSRREEFLRGFTRAMILDQYESAIDRAIDSFRWRTCRAPISAQLTRTNRVDSP